MKNPNQERVFNSFQEAKVVGRMNGWKVGSAIRSSKNKNKWVVRFYKPEPESEIGRMVGL